MIYKLLVLSYKFGLRLKNRNLLKFLTVLLFVAFSANVFSQTDFVQKTEYGYVDWTNQVVVATGKVAIDNEKYPNQAQAELVSERGAIAVAQRNLLEIIKGINVESQVKGKPKTVAEMIDADKKTNTKVAGILKGYRKIGETEFKDGQAKVKIQAPLYQGNSVANSVYKNGNMRPIKPIISNKNYFFYIKSKRHKQTIFPKIYNQRGEILIDFSELYNKDFDNFPDTKKINSDELKKLKADKKNLIIELKEDRKGNLHCKQKGIEWEKIKNEIIAGKRITFFVNR